MPHNRFYIDALLHTNAQLFMEGEEAHHLMRVMRKQEGEVIELVNGRNQLAQATILTIEKRGIRLKLVQVEEERPPSRAVIMCQAIPRTNRLDLIVEKGTELGMTALWLFPGERSEKNRLSETQLKRLGHIAIAAMKQCGRLDLPEIILKPPLSQWKSLELPSYFGDISSQAQPFLSMYQKEEGVLFFIGPESGFTEKEEQHLSYLGAKGVNLHANILRTDTAPLVALSLIAQKQLI
jgi:16S rRNA (uracil1498-N3)-methyltransferase